MNRADNLDEDPRQHSGEPKTAGRTRSGARIDSIKVLQRGYGGRFEVDVHYGQNRAWRLLKRTTWDAAYLEACRMRFAMKSRKLASEHGTSESPRLPLPSEEPGWEPDRPGPDRQL